MARLTVRVQPGARRSGFTGWFGDHPRLAVAAPPVDGAANDECVRVLATTFGVRRRDVRLVVGAASRTKHFEIDGLDEDDLAAELTRLIGGR
ncbi:MAG: DUF167 domain-containing protein [Ilumatobacter sp.]|nr:DUF167 domain-containing protein [Ilumatobacter sp.]